MSKRKVVVIVAVAVAAATLVYYLWLREFLAVDACLDAGGRWDYGRKMCEGARY